MISKDKITELFSTDPGKKIYEAAESAISEHSMCAPIKSGVIVGLSGGADSVMLLLFLVEYARRNGEFKILPVHINHMIREAEAERDELFSCELSKSLGLEFVSARLDVPKYAADLGIGLEEAARELRYREFADIMQGRNDVFAVAVAHNATDNVETVIMNMLRGSGTHGLAGIMPVRDNVIRPLIYSRKEDIVAALDAIDIKYVIDSTNLSCDYKRNFVRNEILPKLREISKNPEEAVTRLSSNLRSDDEYITAVARDFLSEHSVFGTVSRKSLLTLPYAVLSRALKLMAAGRRATLMQNHISGIYKHLGLGDFKISVPGGLDFVAEGDECAFLTKSEQSAYEFSYPLSLGVNEFSDLFGVIIISEAPIKETFSNVYKISIQQCIDFDIINGGLLMRSKKDGDSYSYGKMTHKLKKLFNDKSVPKKIRPQIPVICDEDGIVWVPGFGVRNGAVGKGEGRKLYIALAYPVSQEPKPEQHRLFSGRDFVEK